MRVSNRHADGLRRVAILKLLISVGKMESNLDLNPKGRASPVETLLVAPITCTAQCKWPKSLPKVPKYLSRGAVHPSEMHLLAGDNLEPAWQCHASVVVFYLRSPHTASVFQKRLAWSLPPRCFSKAAC